MSDFKKIADEIIAVDDAMRYVGIIGEKGKIYHGQMKEGKKLLTTQKEQEVLSADLSVMKLMQGLYDESLGTVTFTHTVRDKLHQLVFYIDNMIVYVSCERNIDNHKIAEIVNKIEPIIIKLI